MPFTARTRAHGLHAESHRPILLFLLPLLDFFVRDRRRSYSLERRDRTFARKSHPQRLPQRNRERTWPISLVRGQQSRLKSQVSLLFNGEINIYGEKSTNGKN